MTNDSPDQSAHSANRSFFRHVRNYLSGSVVGSVVLALSFPLLSFLLTPEDYGVISIFTTLVSLLTILFLLNMHAGVARYYLEKFDDFDRSLGSNLLFLAANNVLLLGALVFFSAPISSFFAVDQGVLLYAGVASLLSVLPELYLVYLSASQQSRHYAVLSIIRTVLRLVLMVGIILALEEQKYLGKIYSELAVMGGLSVYAFWSLRKLARFDFDRRYVTYVLRFSLPLIPHTLSRYILGYFDRIQINQLASAADTGVYSFAYDIGMIMSIIVISASRAWRPIFIEEYGAGHFDKLNLMVKAYANQIYLVAAGIALFSADFILAFVDEQFHEAVALIPIIILGYVFVFLYTLYFQYASFRKRTELISVSTLVAGGANIGLNYLFIPIYGYEAAAYTTLACFVLLFVLHFGNAKLILRERLLHLSNLLPGLGLLLTIIIAIMLLDSLQASYLLSLLARLGMAGAAVYIFYWRPKRANGRAE